MFRNLLLIIGAALSLLSLPAAALAFRCDVTATGMSFGSYDIFSSTPLDTLGTVDVACNIPPQNPASPLLVTISLSPGSSGNFAQRQLQSTGAAAMNYNLYTNASFSTIWGDGGGSSTARTAMVTRDSPFSANIYGRIPARQNVPVGTYSDVITVTIEW